MTKRELIEPHKGDKRCPGRVIRAAGGPSA
jgi:hypothetical protein